MKAFGFYPLLPALLFLSGQANVASAPLQGTPGQLVVQKNAALTSGKLESRFIDLLTMVLQRKRVDQRDIEKVMGIQMRPHPYWRGQTYYFGAIGDGRKYLFVYGTFVERKTLRLIFPDVSSPAAKTECLFEFDRLHRDLTRMGFAGARRNGEHAHAPRNTWEYSRNRIEVEVNYDPRKGIRRGEDLVAKNLCVESILINGQER